ncbi:MAG: DJ-1/PfpI family protein [Helicobacter trogontum]|uniref:DJ-1 family glyoxalase III n=1 Tax=Helicobacter trogontum TaxID=50960 RepID=UPI00242DB5F4|nr:DJ-1 family glyoxalase III [Helicobacter trogontum]MCI5785864.1 DJ-1/PfpI family protein [Helicobacter trogontum]
MMKRVLVPLAQGFEEAEFIGVVDVLRRTDVEVLIAGLDSVGNVKGANGIEIKAEVALSSVDVNSLDGIALAGGSEGMKNLCNNDKIIEIIQTLHKKGKIVGAICASPIVLNKAGVISGEFTCYPGCESGINAKRLNEAVVVRDNVITSAGPATAILFGLAIAKALMGEDVYNSLYESMQVPLSKI